MQVYWKAERNDVAFTIQNRSRSVKSQH